MTMAVTDREVQSETLSPKGWLTFFAMTMGAFLALLDIQIVSSSLRPLSAALFASMDEIAWVQSAYLIAEIIIIPLTGWLARSLSSKYLFMIASLGFTVFSLACASAWDLPSMIVFRIFQGILGGAMIPMMFSVIYTTFPKDMQQKGVVIAGLCTLTAPILGPIFGGWITETLSWHWLFLINIPIGILIAWLAWEACDFDKPNYKLLREFDILGVIPLAIFLGTLEFVLKEGTKKDWFESDLITTLSFVSVLSFIFVIWWERRAPHPILDLDLFRNWNFSLGCAVSFILGLLLFGPIYILPAYLSIVNGFNSLQIGTVLLVTGAFQMFSAVLTGIMTRFLEARIVLTIGFILVSIGLWLNGFMTAESGFKELFWPQAIRSLGFLMIVIPVTDLTLGYLDQDKVQDGSGLMNLMRNLGGAVGLAGITWMISVRHDLHLSRLGEVLSEGRIEYDKVQQDPTFNSLEQSTLFSSDHAQYAANTLLEQIAIREAYVMAFNDVWLAMAAITTCGVAAAVLIRPVDSTQSASVAVH